MRTDERRKHTASGDRRGPIPISRRWVAMVLVALMATAVGGVAAFMLLRPQTPSSLVGSVLTPPVSAFGFRLRDPDGRNVSLSSFRGKVVVLTFLYTHCPDVCPLIADTLHRTYAQLGILAPHVAFIAVSVDPRGDTRHAVRTFLAVHHVQGELEYLTGSLAQLRPIWAQYYIGTEGVDPQTGAVVATIDDIAHTALAYVIDPTGRIRVFLPSNFAPNDLVTDLKILAPRPNS
jgi:protein SCO1